MRARTDSMKLELTQARKLWGRMTAVARDRFRFLASEYKFSVMSGDLLFINQHWYVTYSGLLSLAKRKRCSGIKVHPVAEFCDSVNCRYAFKATVYKSPLCRGFTGYGDADPSNVSLLVRGAEMRVAETRAVNRALRKAYGIGICSVEEIGSFDRSVVPEHPVRKLPSKSSNRNGSNGHSGNGNGKGSRVRDRLCQIIRQHKLDAEQVKAYAIDFCGTKTLREASREQVESFVTHLAEWAGKDRNALLCQLNSFQRPEEPATLPQVGAA